MQRDQDNVRDHVAAKLTEAVYPVVLRHSNSAQWLDLELDLWDALTEQLTACNPELR